MARWLETSGSRRRLLRRLVASCAAALTSALRPVRLLARSTGGPADGGRGEPQVPPASPDADGPAGRPHGDAIDRDLLVAVAESVLPGELGGAGREAAVDAFLEWVAGYRAGAVMDHGYGFTSVRHTPGTPAAAYVEQLVALDERSRRRHGSGLVALEPAERRALVAEVVEEAAPDLDQLPGRPTGLHVTVDLLSHWAGSSEANDLCYGRQIRRETCRTLFSALESPPPSLSRDRGESPDGKP